MISIRATSDLALASKLLFRHAPDPRFAARRFQEIWHSGSFEHAIILVAESADDSVGAVFAYCQGPGLAVVWPPVGDSPAVEDALGCKLIEWMRLERVTVAQVVVNRRDLDRLHSLVKHGFQQITELVYFKRDISAIAIPTRRHRLRLRSVTQPTGEFARLIEASYEDSLDCPELNNSRSGMEVLESYLGSSPTPLRWWIAECQDQPVGVLLLHQNDWSTVELTYLGLIASARGKGLGQELLQAALAEAAKCDANHVVLSVDQRNTPALSLYARHGFHEFDRQIAFLWFAKSSQSS